MVNNLVIHKERPCHTSNYKKGRTSNVEYLVIHYVGATGNAGANAKYYGSTANIGASAHYFVGHAPNPEIWASVSEIDTAWHVGNKTYIHPTCRNANSIGIEMCCHKDASGTWYFDKETVDMAVKLCRDIVSRYNIPIDRVLRHHDVTGKICPAPFVLDTQAWNDFKNRIYKEDENVTEKRVQEMINNSINDIKPTVYKTLADVPDWALPTIENLVKNGKLKGDGNGNLNLTEDLTRALVIMSR